ncbi:MAG: AbrB/MazE/SpoVT family DNA-binding domain-containing protein [Planctomycetota bacterium]|nr:AbrB/MazE/SpoVT family DNA-binding domain-containing protein [Planctomycetota bacterium]
MDTAKLFRNGQSQAVRLPKSYRMKGRQVRIKRVGQAVVLYPMGKEWEVFEEGLRHFSEDFLADRAQPKRVQKRKRAFGA